MSSATIPIEKKSTLDFSIGTFLRSELISDIFYLSE
nr:MAG TPA: hypothetical protein [Caudoviricetes sp.]DAY66737.1 MAG TPA: hypothetical protein [Caudoviricetes sp.]